LARFFRSTGDRVIAAQRSRLQAVAVNRPVLFAVVSLGKWLIWDLPAGLVRRIVTAVRGV